MASAERPGHKAEPGPPGAKISKQASSWGGRRACRSACDYYKRLVPEMPHICEHHGNSCFVRSGDHLLVADRPAWLDHGLGPRRPRRFQPGGEGEERARGDDTATEVELGRSTTPSGDARRVDPVHLSGADADGGTVLGIDDGVVFHML